MSVDVIEQIALVSGVVLHRGTGKPIPGEVTFTAVEGPVATKVLSDGTFAVSGWPPLLFPDLANSPAQFHVTMQAKSDYFRQGLVEHSVTANVPQNFQFPAPIDLGTLRLPVSAAAQQANITVTIRGRVVRADDLDTPVAGASIELIQSAVVTDSRVANSQGRYSFDEVVVAAPAELRCSAAGFDTQTRLLLIDFSLSLHEEVFRLAPP